MIKELRRTYNLTQSELSELTGIPKRTLQNWEYEVRKAPDYMKKYVSVCCKDLESRKKAGEYLSTLDIENISPALEMLNILGFNFINGKVEKRYS